jgi:hypothetical protein
MARIRTIKPEFWTSEQVVDCSPIARLLFIGMLNFCDDAGRHIASTRRLKMEVFPADDLAAEDIAGMIEQLIKAGLLVAYENGGERFWEVTGWDRHQKIERKTVRHPGALDDGSTIIRRHLDDTSTSIRPRNGREWIGVERNGIPPHTALAYCGRWRTGERKGCGCGFAFGLGDAKREPVACERNRR